MGTNQIDVQILSMQFIQTPFDGLLILEPTVFSDDRGSFMETYNKEEFMAHGVVVDFVQDNLSISRKGVIRGLHFQCDPHAQGKLVRVLKGKAWDVVVDLRPASTTFGRSYGVELDALSGKQLWIPPGFAHGFEALEDDTVFSYKVTAYYNKSSESGIRFDDPELNIKWHTHSPILSAKDKILPTLREWNSR